MGPSILRPSEHGGNEGREARKHRLYESRREREFYSYYESVLAYASKEPKFCNLYDSEIAASHEAVSSSDKTLTAFTQLAALQLEARRAMIFFFDSAHAYVIAESTRTLSLDNDSHHAPSDSLWLGFTKIPRGLSVCEVTTTLPANGGSNAQDADTKSIAHIINNLTEDTRFCDRPYVQDGPKARFYAGVPITTPKGINIGALCVLDDKPRDGLKLGQVDLLRNLASAIMSHLELVRAKEDNQRSRDMKTALGAFIEGRSDSRDWWHRSGHNPTNALGHPEDASEPRIQTLNERVPITPKATDRIAETSAGDEYFATKGSHCTGEDTKATSTGNLSTHDRPSNSQTPTDNVASSRPTLGSRNGSNSSTGSAAPSHTRDDEPDEDLSTRIKATASRAAGLIQKGLCADGVMFLDATVGSFGGLINGTQGLSQTETETDTSHVSDAGNASQQGIRQEKTMASKIEFCEPPKHSVVLGSAYSIDIETRVREAMQQAKFSEKVLRSLLRRYPDGQVWHFNGDGEASDEDEYVSDEGLSSASAGESAGSELEQSTTPSSKRAAKKIRARKKDGRAIQDIFPGIRSLVFLGMWDPHQERWFGASIVLSYSSTRMFSVRNELSYLAAFCDVVLGEIWRLESQELGRSKNDFISSISHELRSPLHGILGSAECLEEQEQSVLGRELIRSINSCGTTLLDVINDLLEYSRLNHGTQKRRKMDPSQSSNMASDSSAASYPSEAESAVMLSTLTEDAVNAACLGFNHQTIKHDDVSGSSDEHQAVIALTIDEFQNSDWLLCVASGSWKRICLNLVSNALKYTSSGYINVSLRRKPLQKRAGKERIAHVELVVEDSGIGMSDQFQVKCLFRPFKQENSLTPGTGLGLNLVAQIVRSLDGNVHVRSKQGAGTTVRVSLPLRCSVSPPAAVAPNNLDDLSSINASVGFLGFGDLDINPIAEPMRLKANKRLLNSLKRGCKQLGLPICAIDDILENNASVYVVRMEALERLFQTDSSGMRHSLLSSNNLRRPLIIICPTRDSALKLRVTPIATRLPSRAQYIWLPVGPVKLADAISNCLKPHADNRYIAAALDTAELPSSNEASGSVPIKPVVNETPPAIDAGKGGPISDSASKSIQAIDEKDEKEQVSQPIIHRRSGSVDSSRPGTPSLQIRTGIGRATTAPNRSADVLSLLLVDDNAINLRLLEVFAKKAGHFYRTAQNGQEAIEIYESAAIQGNRSQDSLDQAINLVGKPEVVLMDINMPVVDGFEAARTIRRFEKASGTPRASIIAVTGLGDTSAQEEAFASGMDLFLTKPVKMKEVTEILAKIRGIGS